MKKFIILVAFAALFFTSCNKGDGSVLVQAVVTVCGQGTDKCTLNLDDNTVLVPENLSRNPFAGECRAFTYYKDKGKIDTPVGGDTRTYRTVELIRLDSILTKAPVPSLGSKELNDDAYGTAPLELYRSWMTVVEDGYVTLHFLGKWGIAGKTHYLHLVKDVDAQDPLHFELRHDYNGDDVTTYFRWVSGIVAFNIKDILAKEKKSTYDITISFKGNLQDKNVVFHYTPGASSILGEEAFEAVSNAGDYK